MAAKTWTQTSGNLWSTGANWNGGTVPATTDTVTFNGTSTANCTIDNLGTWSGGTFTIAAAYSGTITVNTGVNVNTAAFSQAAGVWTGNSGDTFTSTTYALSAGTFNMGGAFTSTTFAVTATGNFQGASAAMSTTAVTFSGSGGGSTIKATSGTWSLAGSWTQSTSSTTFTHNSGTINITAASTFNDARSTFNLCNITTTNALVTISASTTFPLGATPTTTTGTNSITVTGTLTFSGNWTHTGSLTVTGTLTGTSTPTLSIDRSLTTSSATITNAIGTVTFNGNVTSQTYTDTGDKLSASTFVISQTGASNVTIAANTTMRLGANPTTTGTNTITVNGTLTCSGTLTVAHFLTVASTGTMNGGFTNINLVRSLTINSGATFPANIILDVGTTGTMTITAPGITFGNCTASSRTASWTIAANTTIPFGLNPSVLNDSAATLTVTGTLSWSGTMALTGSLTATGTLTGTSSPAINVTEGSPNFTGATLTNTFDLTVTQTSATARTFTGGGKTFGTFTRAGSGSGTLTIASSNTFTSFVDSAALVAHTLTFTAGTTQTMASFDVRGKSGTPVTLNSTVDGNAWTLTKTGGADVFVNYLSIKDSTVDATPDWYAGANSTNVSGNTNWLFESPQGAGGSRGRGRNRIRVRQSS